MTGTKEASAGLAFATPGDWLTIRVPREQGDAARLASEVTAARPELAARRAAVERMLHGLIEACASLDVLGAYTTVLDVPGGPLPATLVTSVRPMGAQTLDDIARDMTAGDGALAPPDVRMFDLLAGRTVRVERLRQWGPSLGQQLISLVVQYVAEIPGTGGAVLLTFATPALSLASELRQVFHQIACTVHFDGLNQPSDEPGQRPDGRGQPAQDAGQPR